MRRRNPCLDALQDEATRLDEHMVELSLLLPGWQAEALATEAHDQGLTPAQMVRRLIHDFFARRKMPDGPGATGPLGPAIERWA